jgi:hypothetical protein
MVPKRTESAPGRLRYFARRQSWPHRCFARDSAAAGERREHEGALGKYEPALLDERYRAECPFDQTNRRGAKHREAS